MDCGSFDHFNWLANDGLDGWIQDIVGKIKKR